MNNSQISARLQRLAAMMSLLEENSYKVRSFEKAARIVKEHDEDMGVLVDEDRLKDVPGVGSTLAYVIMYYAKAGTVGMEQELEAQLPDGLPDLLELPGLGMKKVQTPWQKHSITNVDQLKQACDLNRLTELKGFGPKIQDKLLQSIEFRSKHVQDYYLDTALEVAGRWAEILESIPSVKKFEITGKLRRGDKLLKAVEFIVVADPEKLVLELNDRYNFGLEDSTPLTIQDKTGIPVCLEICTHQTFSANQLFLTGGEIYGKQLEKLYGKDPDIAIQMLGQEVKNGTEKLLCESINLQWIEPELRDSYAQFPDRIDLLTDQDIKGTFHALSKWSDGRNSLEEMATAAELLGYQYLGISEHSQAAYYANGLTPDRVKEQWDLIDALNTRNSNFHIFKGIEADILSDGQLDYDETLLEGFDFVIASIHSHFHLDPIRQTERIVRALQSPFTTMLGHPTGRMLMARPGYEPDVPAIIDVAAENDKIIEINTTPKRLDLDWQHLRYAREKGVKISINPDAHSIKGLETVPLGVRMARKGGLSKAEVLNTLDVTDMKKYLDSRKIR